jgi:uncharacterized protein YdaU (DUF1376 family)
MKIRHVDFDIAEWIAETHDLSLEQRGVYSTAWALILRHGGPVRRDDLRRACPGDKRVYGRAFDGLLERGKVVDVDGIHITIPRCENELEKAWNRIETARENGAKSRGSTVKNPSKFDPVSSENNGLESQVGPLYTRESTSHHQPKTSNQARFARKTRASEEVAAVQSDFEEWWREQPHKVGQVEAFEAYSLAHGRAGPAALLTGLRRYIADKPPDQKWLNPANWLKRQRWGDRPAPQQPSSLIPLNGGSNNVRSGVENLFEGAVRAADKWARRRMGSGEADHGSERDSGTDR